MFSNLFISVFLGIGVGGWVYAKLQRYTGGNAQSSLIGAAVCGLLACLISTTLMTLVL